MQSNLTRKLFRKLFENFHEKSFENDFGRRAEGLGEGTGKVPQTKPSSEKPVLVNSDEFENEKGEKTLRKTTSEIMDTSIKKKKKAVVKEVVGSKVKEKESEGENEVVEKAVLDDEINIGETPNFLTPTPHSQNTQGSTAPISTPLSPFMSSTTTTITQSSSVSGQDALDNPIMGGSSAPVMTVLQEKAVPPSAGAVGKVAATTLEKLAVMAKSNPALAAFGDPLNVQQLREVFRQEAEDEAFRKKALSSQGEDSSSSEEMDRQSTPSTNNNQDVEVDEEEVVHQQSVVKAKEAQPQLVVTQEMMSAMIAAALQHADKTLLINLNFTINLNNPLLKLWMNLEC